MADDYYQNILKTRDKLNEVGPGFCLMKWQTQTLYLHMGDNHSCYHPRPHKITKEDIARSPSGLHNTAQKKLARKEMLEGGRPSECYYCWNIEDMGGDHISDRMIHSTSAHANADLDAIKNLPWDADWNPRHIEVSFGNGCNFKCGYCCPQASSSWVDEIKRHGRYDITTPQYDIGFLNGEFYNGDDPNPYVDAFWKWWPDLSKDLKIFRITGGEPLMNPNTFKLLDMLDTDPAPHLKLHCNSNLGVSERRVDLFCDKVASLLAQKKVQAFRLFTSIDSWGAAAEYMRFGLKCDLWERNLFRFLDTVPDGKVSFMITFNVLSVATFIPLLEKILEWRARYPAADGRHHNQRVNMDTPYLKEPPHWMINILPASFMSYMHETLTFMRDNRRSETRPNGFDTVEIEKFKRVVDYMEKNPVQEETIRAGRRDFYTFFTEHDRRRGTDFAATFPKYAEFMNLCRETYESYGK